ncbi:MAG: F0F1 ATP synthase subunit A, partial [Sporomusaceae bacterium]|nr:F0F1 ATP synthase subunit A [Sporomusaceae bacterium]
MEHGGGHEIGGHKLAHFMGMTFNMDTLMMTWLTMAIVIVMAVLATRRIELRPRGWQNFLEMVLVAFLEQIEASMGAKGKQMAPLIITLFLFILVGNQLGLVPGFTSPTNDLNTTLGLALMVVMIVHVLGVKNKGLGYLKHFFEPYKIFVIINVVEELAKPITLSFRLFGNIIAGEVLLIILNQLVPYFAPT